LLRRRWGGILILLGLCKLLTIKDAEKRREEIAGMVVARTDYD